MDFGGNTDQAIAEGSGLKRLASLSSAFALR